MLTGFMLERVAKVLALVAVQAAATPSSATAAPVPGGIWYTFCFGASDTLAHGECGGFIPDGVVFAPAAPWTSISAAGGLPTFGLLATGLLGPGVVARRRRA